MEKPGAASMGRVFGALESFIAVLLVKKHGLPGQEHLSRVNGNVWTCGITDILFQAGATECKRLAHMSDLRCPLCLFVNGF